MNTQNSTQADYAATLLRLSLGVMFIAHGWLKVAVFTPAGTVGYFESLGLPGILAHLTIAFEIIGGALLVAGYQTRMVSLASVPLLLGSLWFAHAGNGWLFSNAGGGWEYPLFLAMAAAVQSLLGDGAYALRSIRGRNPVGALSEA